MTSSDHSSHEIHIKAAHCDSTVWHRQFHGMNAAPIGDMLSVSLAVARQRDGIAMRSTTTCDSLRFYQQGHMITWSGASHHSTTGLLAEKPAETHAWIHKEKTWLEISHTTHSIAGLMKIHVEYSRPWGTHRLCDISTISPQHKHC